MYLTASAFDPCSETTACKYCLATFTDVPDALTEKNKKSAAVIIANIAIIAAH